MKVFFLFFGVYGLKWSNNQYDGYDQRAYSNYEGILRKMHASTYFLIDF